MDTTMGLSNTDGKGDIQLRRSNRRSHPSKAALTVCAVQTCNSTGETIDSKGQSLEFFALPDKSDADLRAKWRKAVRGIAGLSLPNLQKVCSLHFVDGCPSEAHPYPTLELGNKDSATSGQKSTPKIERLMVTDSKRQKHDLYNKDQRNDIVIAKKARILISPLHTKTTERKIFSVHPASKLPNYSRYVGRDFVSEEEEEATSSMILEKSIENRLKSENYESNLPTSTSSFPFSRASKNQIEKKLVEDGNTFVSNDILLTESISPRSFRSYEADFDDAHSCSQKVQLYRRKLELLEAEYAQLEEFLTVQFCLLSEPSPISEPSDQEEEDAQTPDEDKFSNKSIEASPI